MSAENELDMEEKVQETAPPLLKKRTKRGLAQKSAILLSAPSTASHMTDVYSSCVDRASALSEINQIQIPLTWKTSSLSDVQTKSAKNLQPTSSTFTSLETSVEVDDENMLSLDVTPSRSPSPPPSPPEKYLLRATQRPVPKKFKKVFKKLESAKDILKKNAVSPVTVDDAKLAGAVINRTIVVRVRYLCDIHRFSMAMTEKFYSLLKKMAGILSVNEDELGLYLKDDRISPSDTPSSVNLHIADILECHILTSKGSASKISKRNFSADTIRLLLQCPNKRDNIHMDIKKYQPFSVIIERYAAMRGKPVDRFCFQVDGDVVDPDSTPENLDLDNDDTIDVVEKNDKDV